MKPLSRIPKQLTPEYCTQYLEGNRWKGIPTCPYCSSGRATRIIDQHRYHCNNCNTAYSVTVGTLFHHTHVPLNKWFWAIVLVLSNTERISGRQLALALGINKNTACKILNHVQENVKDIRHRDFLEEIASTVKRSFSMEMIQGEFYE